MTYTQFKHQLVNRLRQIAGPDTEVTLDSVPKNNGVKKDAVLINESGDQVVPVIYLDEFYERFKNGATIAAVAELVLEAYHMSELEESYDFEQIATETFDEARDYLYFKVVSAGRNKEQLEEIPYHPFLDLAKVFYRKLEFPNGEAAARIITNEDMQNWNISLEELEETADRNTMTNFPATFQEIQDAINGDREIMEEAPRDGHLFVLTCKDQWFGAGTILYPHTLENLGRRLAVSYYVLPCSIHEVLILPDNGYVSKTELDEMVKDINRSCLRPDDVLSDHAYYFDLKDNVLTM